MQSKKNNQDRIILLELFFNKDKSEKFVISMNSYTAESMIKFDLADLEYVSSEKSFVLCGEEIIRIIRTLKYELKIVLKGKSYLHNFIKNSLGYYQTKDYKKKNRKDLVYETLDNGYVRWVGKKHMFFSGSSPSIPSSWLYNDKDENIILEISPTYPWLFNAPKKGEKFIKYSEWMKSYKPYVVTQIPQDIAQHWIKEIDKLMAKVKRSDKKFRCTGLGCKHCVKEGKTGCPCGSKIKELTN